MFQAGTRQGGLSFFSKIPICRYNQGMNLTKRTLWIGLVVLLAAAVLVTLAGPIERTLGANLRLVVLHGAWVWAGKAAFALAGLAGLAGLLWGKRRAALTGWSLALGRTGLAFWLTYLPMSLLVMQLNWGGLFFDEPRWRVPFTFGVVAVLLQAGLAVLRIDWLTCAANLVFGAALWAALGGAANVLHPDSPIFGGDSARIQVFFIILLVLALGVGAVFTLLVRRKA
mgnify:FL=1